MADVEIAVEAEGVEDAVGEVPEGEASDVDAGGGDGDGGRFGGGKLGKVLSVLAVIAAALLDVGKVIGVISSVLRAFLAPLAVLFLRLFAPVLRLLLSMLPMWLSLFENINSKLEGFPGLIPFLAVMFFKLIAKLKDLASGVWADIKQKIADLPRLLGEEIAQRVPFLDAPGGGDDGGAGGDGFGADDAVQAGAQGFATGGPVGALSSVVIQGGLSQFIERIDRDSGVESP